MQNNELPIWDLSELYFSFDDPRIQKDLNAMSEIRTKLIGLHNKLNVVPIDISAWSQAFEWYNAHTESAHKILNYARLRTDEDTSQQTATAFLQKMQQEIAEAEAQLTFFPLLVSGLNQENAQKLSADPQAAKYQEYIRNAARLKPHLLSEKEERLLVLTMQREREAWMMFENQLSTRLPYGSLMINGQETPLNASLINTLLESPDPELRARAYERRCLAFQQENENLSFAYQQQIRNVLTETNLRGYTGILDNVADNDDISADLIPILVDRVSKQQNVFKKFFQWKAKRLNQEKLKAQDISAPLPHEQERSIPWNEAVELTLNSYQKLGPDFKELAQNFFTNPWIHASPDSRKYTGAYCMYAGEHPYLLVNYHGKLTDISTLAHETGHGIHGLLFKDHKLLQRHPGLILAETASQLGELMLLEELKTKDAGLYRSALHNFLTHSMNAVFQQTLITKFELYAFTQAKKDSVTADQLADKWLELKRELGGDSIEYPDMEQWTWARISHIYFHPFYCYSYAMSLLLVLTLAQQFSQDNQGFAERFKSLLSAGGTLKAQNSLQQTMNFNLDQGDFIEPGFVYLNKLVNECIDDI